MTLAFVEFFQQLRRKILAHLGPTPRARRSL
jgi:hypothetical protein